MKLADLKQTMDEAYSNYRQVVENSFATERDFYANQPITPEAGAKVKEAYQKFDAARNAFNSHKLMVKKYTID